MAEHIKQLIDEILDLANQGKSSEVIARFDVLAGELERLEVDRFPLERRPHFLLARRNARQWATIKLGRAAIEAPPKTRELLPLLEEYRRSPGSVRNWKEAIIEVTPRADGGKAEASNLASLESLLIRGRKLLEETDAAVAHAALLQWVEDVATWLERKQGDSRLSAEWSGLRTSVLIMGSETHDNRRAWLRFKDAVRERLRWLGPVGGSTASNVVSIGEPIAREMAADSDIRLLSARKSGAFGVVWEAEQVSLGRKVAVKIVFASMQQESSALEHARALARLQHANVVTVHLVTVVEDPKTGELTDAVVFEWLVGKDLAERLEGAFFAATEAKMICFGILDGVEHIHANGLVHGDLHPGNVFADAGKVKIIDIKYSESHSLRYMQTASRDALIKEDVDACRHLMRVVLYHSDVDPRVTAAHESDLCRAKTLLAIRDTMARVFADSKEPSASTPDIKTELLEAETLKAGYPTLRFIFDSLGNRTVNSFGKSTGGGWSDLKRNVVHAGDKITIEAVAMSPGAPVDFRFEVQRSGQGFTVRRPWSSEEKWVWSVDEGDIGRGVIVKVSVRCVKSHYQFGDTDDYTYAIYNVLPVGDGAQSHAQPAEDR